MTNIREVFENVNGASFISIDTETTPKLKGGQKNPMQGQIRKVMVGANVMVFTNKKSNGYDNMVKRRLAQEGKDPESFKLSERSWGQRIAGTPFVEHNGELYIEVIFLKPGKVEYKHGVRPIDRNDIIGLEQKDEAEQGGLEDKVVIRTFKADSIKRVAVDKQVFTF